jgi:hypothetical protein
MDKAPRERYPPPAKKTSSRVGRINLEVYSTGTTEKWFLIVMGAGLVLTGIILFVKSKGADGKNRVKFLSAEFELSTPSLVFLVLGFLLVVFPFWRMQSQQAFPNGEQAQDATASSGGTPTREYGSTESAGHIYLKIPGEDDLPLSEIDSVDTSSSMGRILEQYSKLIIRAAESGELMKRYDAYDNNGRFSVWLTNDFSGVDPCFHFATLYRETDGKIRYGPSETCKVDGVWQIRPDADFMRLLNSDSTQK